VWAFCSTVNLHSPTVFQILRFLSLPPLAICLLSGEKATARTSLEWPTNLLMVYPFLRSQSLRVPSHDEVKQYLLSCERARSLMKWECPENWLIYKKFPTLQDFLCDSPFFVWVSLALLLDIPNHDGFISSSWDEELSGLVSFGDFSDLHASNPTVVA